MVFAPLLLLSLTLAACASTSTTTATNTGGAGPGGTGVSTTSSIDNATAGTPLTLSPPDSIDQGTSVTDITVPSPDDPRARIYEALGWEDGVYVVYRLEMQDGFAYLHGLPFTGTHGPSIDSRALLMQTADGAWRVLEKIQNEGLLTDMIAGHSTDDQVIIGELKTKYPDAPEAIFPEPASEQVLVARPILDAIRSAMGDPGYRFSVWTLQTAGDWAYTELRALLYQEGRITDSQTGKVLLRNVAGDWTVLLARSADGTSGAEFADLVKQQYPEAPAEILPGSQSG